MPDYGFCKDKNCICDFPTLVILILIILQFSKKDDKGYDRGHDKGCGDSLVDNGLLFIIALFFLSCAVCKKTSCGC